MTRRADDLELMRSVLLDALKEVEAKDKPRVARELRAVNAELDALAPPISPGQRLADELKARRARRTAT